MLSIKPMLIGLNTDIEYTHTTITGQVGILNSPSIGLLVFNTAE